MSDSDQPNWGYGNADGPDHWAEISQQFYLCAEGHAQSPIDIHPAEVMHTHLPQVDFDYHDMPLRIFNNGHTIQVNCDAGSLLTHGDRDYRLVQFHLHHPSEHRIDGRLTEMELHLVHQDAEGHFLVVGVMLDVGETENTAYKAVFDYLPTQVCDPPAGPAQRVDPTVLLPQDRHVYSYSGSLTTPPCSQGVRWLIFKEVVYLSQAQVDAFTAIYPDNARPVQPMNDRHLFDEE